MSLRRRAPRDEDWVRIFQGSGPTDAYLVRDWLLRNGVPAEVRGESLMSLRGDVPVGEAWPAVWSPQGHRARAETLIADFDGPTLVHPPWQCGGCGEENAPNFASCWSCGLDRPDVVGRPLVGGG